jgi:hypothetical protein
MRDHAGAHHVQIDILDAIPQVLAVLDHGAVIAILPIGTASVFSPVEVARKTSFQLLHHATDASAL